jgi:hypothetical protein
MLARQYGHDPAAIHIASDVRTHVCQVLFLGRAYRVVREEDEQLFPREAAERMVQIDPLGHPGLRAEIAARRA